MPAPSSAAQASTATTTVTCLDSIVAQPGAPTAFAPLDDGAEPTMRREAEELDGWGCPPAWFPSRLGFRSLLGGSVAARAHPGPRPDRHHPRSRAEERRAGRRRRARRRLRARRG